MSEAVARTIPRRRPSIIFAVLSTVAAVVAIAAPIWQLARSAPSHVTRLVPATPARLALEQGLAVLDSTLGVLAIDIDAPGPRLRTTLRSARISYKRIETLLSVYGPTLAAGLNGPFPEESEDRPAGPLGAPAGFQIIEAAAFGGESPGRDSLLATATAMRRAVATFRPLLGYVAITESAVLDAIRLELARVEVLGLAGVDTDLSGDAVVESAAALEGARILMKAGAGTGKQSRRYAAIDIALDSAVSYLRAHPQFDRLNRMEFIVRYANPAARAVAVARADLPPSRPLRRLWRQEAATLFDSSAFDGSAYAPDYATAPSPALVQLGQRLFLEPRLSGPGTRSCAFCHDPNRAFTDGLAHSRLLLPASRPRNTPTLLDAGYQPALFADSRAGSLEIQAGAVLASPSEMGGSADLAATRLLADPRYRQAFVEVFGRSDSALTGRSVRVALAAYVRSLGPLHSPLDRALQGDTLALSESERRGFTIFMGKGRCGTCHFAPLFNGTLPPDYVVSEPEIIGVPIQPKALGARLDPDSGRGDFDHEPRHQGAFKVPTLRNVALTAPYMHNGAFATLEQVIDFYDRGGGAGVGARVPDQTLPVRRLYLSAKEKDDLVAMLRALSDTVVSGER